MAAAEAGKTAGREFRNRRSRHYGLSGGLLWSMVDRSKALRVVFVGFCGFFFGCCGFFGSGDYEASAGRHVYLVLGGFVAIELVLDAGQSAEKQAGDVGESSGAAGGDVAAGEETKEMGEGMVDALGGLKVFGVLGEQVGEVVGVGGWRFGVAGTELGVRVLVEASALAAGGGVVLAAFGSAGGLGVGFGVRVRCFHGRSFLGSNFISKKFNLRGGVYPLFSEKRPGDTENKENRARKKRSLLEIRSWRLEIGGAKKQLESRSGG